MFAKVEPWILKAWVIEGYLFLPDLEKKHLAVFSRRGMAEDKYLEYIPFSWISANGLENTQAGAQILFGMMMISMMNFQVDEFFDGVIAKADLLTIAQLRRSIKKLFSDLEIVRTRDIVNGLDAPNDHDRDVYRQLEDFLRFVVTYPQIQNASAHDKAQLQLELKFFLLAHTQQIEDNFKFQRQSQQKTYSTPPSSYMRWVRTTASDHLSARYAFAFLICLLGNDQDYLPNSEIKYIAEDCCARSSVLCRMFNDYGSLERDRKESNVNSICFPEFDGEEKDEKNLLAELVRLTTYERKFLDLSFDELKRACGGRHRRIYDTTRLFYNASELYSEVYKVNDLSVSH